MTAPALAVATPAPTVPRLWPGETVVCIASGPSLTAADVTSCRGKARVIAVNNGYQLAPWADVLYACDARWWGWHRGVMDFAGMKYSLDRPDRRYGVTTLAHGAELGLSLDPTALCTGRNSGYQALNLAVLFGVARIVLLGYDCQLGPGGQEHWHGDHNPHAHLDAEFLRQKLARFGDAFASLVAPLRAAGVEVVNCTRRTALDCFPRQPLEATL